jgi:LmbE family N-acetylglucosaminyl deacetylase
MFYVKIKLHMSYGVNTADLRTLAVPFSASDIKNFGSTIVFAPHPDDESLACGGLIALLRSFNNSVHVVFVSDGSMSHPGSVKFPPAILSQLRRDEALEALSFLHVPATHVFFMGLKDGSLPGIGLTGFEGAVDAACVFFNKIRPGTIIVPWRRDTHQDHRACWQMTDEALKKFHKNVLVLEYPLWLWERGNESDSPGDKEVAIRSVNIAAVTSEKLCAINAHRSQVTRMIDDDPNGFWLSPEVISHFTGPEEIYLVKKSLPLRLNNIVRM